MISDKVLFFAKEIPKSIGKLDSYSKYVRRFVDARDITKIRFRDYKDTNLTILWSVTDTAPVVLVNISGALSLIQGLNAPKVLAFKRAIDQQIHPQRMFQQSHLRLNHSNKDIFLEIYVLKSLLKELEQRHVEHSGSNRSKNGTNHDKDSNTNDRFLKKNLSRFISISQIASDDYNESPYWLNKLLVAFHVQYKRDGVGPYRLCHPDRKYAELLYRKGGHTCLKWHSLGRKLIHRVMYRHGYSWNK